MKFEHIAGIYEWLNAQVEPARLQAHLAECLNLWNDDAREAILYIPMYSWGIKNPLITPRIEFLQRNGWNSEKFAAATDGLLDKLECENLSDGRRFGFRCRLDELRERSRQLVKGSPHLRPAPTAFDADRVKEKMSDLQRFRGVGRKAALHVLMDLGWPVFIPDRQLLRFLYRVDAVWRPFLRSDSGSCMLPDQHLYEFLALWNDKTAAIRTNAMAGRVPQYARGVPTLDTLKPRQIDILIMLFTQDVGRGSEGWRPAPICNFNPNCEDCPISSHCCYFGEIAQSGRP